MAVAAKLSFVAAAAALRSRRWAAGVVALTVGARVDKRKLLPHRGLRQPGHDV